jgi:hypothetical protein
MFSAFQLFLRLFCPCFASLCLFFAFSFASLLLACVFILPERRFASRQQT